MLKILVTIINFTVTAKGLEDQLLGELAAKEKPEVEEKRADLVLRIASDKKQLKDIEDKILKVIYQSEGNILQDELLITTLNDAKSTSTVIQFRVKEAEETEIKINTLREAYRPVAVRGSIIYFCIADLSLIDPMYQYSLGFISNLYSSCIEFSPKSNDIHKRLNILTKTITKAVFTSVSRGLFEEHKLLFAFMLCLQILKQQGVVSEAEVSLFLRGTGNQL
jgi:dynein heavy chain